MPDPNQHRADVHERLFAFLRLIRQRTISRDREWPDADWAKYLDGRKVLDRLLVLHGCQQFEDHWIVRMVAERVRRKFYAKALGEPDDKRFQEGLECRLWENLGVDMWIYKTTRSETSRLVRVTSAEESR